jgi:putative transposase
MTSKNVATLLADLGVARSNSRPRVSNDNPYSEAQFKTLKYCRRSPAGSVRSPTPARSAEVFQYYNHEHRHSGIGLHAPASVHDGTATAIRAERIRGLHAAHATNPARFRHAPTPPPTARSSLDHRTTRRERRAGQETEQAA